jgi:uncharacterized protein (TIGR00297 family)
MNLFAAPSPSEWTLFFLLFVAIGLFISAAEFLRKRFNGSPEITRKLVHILTGLLIFFAPDLFTSGIPAIALAIVFIAVNYAAIRFGLLKGMHGTNRRSYGTVYYPLSFLILVLLFWDSAPFIISVSILILAFGDAAAAIVGENLSSAHTFNLTSDKKSFEGSTAMFVVTSLIVAGAVWHYELRYEGIVLIWIIVAIAAFVTVWEAISSKGFDNLTIPLGAAFMLHFFFIGNPIHDPQQMFHAVVLGTGIAMVSARFHFLTPSGSVATLLLATIVYGIGGWKWTLPIFVFFIASSLLSKYKKSRKKKFNAVFDKNDKRDEGQVAANGGVAGIIVLVWYFFPDRTELYYVYLAALAAVTADTWGTEIGILGKGRPVSIASFKHVEPGTSGGVSWIGFLGGMIGALLIVVTAWFYDSNGISLSTSVMIVLSGVVGSLIDSIAGGTIQAQYQTESGALTERTEFNGKPTALMSGIRWIDNDVVNWICAVAGALCMYLLL